MVSSVLEKERQRVGQAVFLGDQILEDLVGVGTGSHCAAKAGNPGSHTIRKALQTRLVRMSQQQSQEPIAEIAEHVRFALGLAQQIQDVAALPLLLRTEPEEHE